MLLAEIADHNCDELVATARLLALAERALAGARGASERLDEAGQLAGAYLRSIGGSGKADVVRDRRALGTWLLRQIEQRMRRTQIKPYTVRSKQTTGGGAGRELVRREMTDTALDVEAAACADLVIDAISTGYFFAEFRANLPRVNDAARELVRDVARVEIQGFDADGDAATTCAKRALKAMLRAMGYPAPLTKSLFDGERKANAKATASA
jgi:hypothetical protein